MGCHLRFTSSEPQISNENFSYLKSALKELRNTLSVLQTYRPLPQDVPENNKQCILICAGEASARMINNVKENKMNIS